LPGDLGHHRIILFGEPKLEELLGVLDVPCELLDVFELLLYARALSRDRLRLLRILPEPRGEGLLVETVDLALQLGDVKDAPLAS
jgi:hypothetical protein